MLWQILGQMNTSISREHIMTDLNFVLKMMVLEQSTSLSEKICNPTGWRHEALIHTKTHQNLRCRLSLTMQLITSKFALIKTFFGEVMAESIDSCVVSQTRMQQIKKYIMQLLPKINNIIDRSNAALLKQVDQFLQTCFAGVFGELQQDLMTMSFVVQMYIVAYIDTSAQPAFYTDVVSFFNNRTPKHAQRALDQRVRGPQLPSLSNMSIWNSKHKFSDDFMSAIFNLFTIWPRYSSDSLHWSILCLGLVQGALVLSKPACFWVRLSSSRSIVASCLRPSFRW